MNKSINGPAAEINQSNDSLRAEMNGLRADMNSRLNTLLVVMVAYWVTLIAAIIGLYFK